MNHAFRLIWSRNQGMLVPVPEGMTASAKGDRRLRRRLRRLMRKTVSPGEVAVLAAVLGALPSAVQALPTGGSVAAGQASIAQAGNTTTITQQSSRAILDWKSFDIGAGQTVTFRQPSTSSIALNRVTGSSASAIYGHLNANGQVFLVNPNGIYFAPGAQVNVGGIVASTLGVNGSDFMAGKALHFSGSSTAGVVNDGTVTAAPGGYVAFIGRHVDNEGNIVTPGGTAALGAGGAVDMTLAGNSLLSFQVSADALNAEVKNGGAILAEDGAVVLSASARDALLQTVVNNTGVIEAQGVRKTAGGAIQLLGGGSGTVRVSGTVDASSATDHGGTITVTGAHVTAENGARLLATGATGGGTIAFGGGWQGAGGAQTQSAEVASGAVLDASATAQGNGGTISVWSSLALPGGQTLSFGTLLAKGGPQGGDGGQVEVRGTTVTLDDSASLAASGAQGGTISVIAGGTLTLAGALDASGTGTAGGFIETSGEQVSFASVATVDPGAGGEWLIDPTDLTIDANAAATLVNAPNGVNGGWSISVTTTASGAVSSPSGIGTTSSGPGDIYINAPLNWTSGSGTLTFSAYHSIFVNAPISVPAYGKLHMISGTDGTGGALEISAPINLRSTSSFSTQDGSAAAISYTILTTASALQNINTTGLSGNYALGSDIDLSSIANFAPIGTRGSPFKGRFEGLDHAISNLNISRALTNDIGLFGHTSNATLRDVGLVAESVAGGSNTGGLVGDNHNSTIAHVYATGSVSGAYNAGGLVGTNYGSTITDAYETGSVKGTTFAGGIAGGNSHGTISDAYATGSVKGSSDVGGLVGSNYVGTIKNAYATGSVTGTSAVGGLVGSNGGTITNAYWVKLRTASGNATKTVGSGSGGSAISSTNAFASGSYTGFTFTTTPGASGNAWVLLDKNGSLNNASGAAGATLPMLASECSTTIENTHQLQLMAMAPGARYTLGRDINATATGSSNTAGKGTDIWGPSGFVPVGTSVSPFTGTFDGLDHSVSNLTIDLPTNSNVGLFGYAKNATLDNVGLTGGSVTGKNYVGALVGTLNGTTSGALTNAYATGSVTGYGYVGGLVGDSYFGTITGAYATGSVTGGFRVGGLVGSNYTGTITNAYATGSVTGSANRVGGLVGYSDFSSAITNTYATGRVTGSGPLGGLVGSNYSSTVKDSYWDTGTTGQTVSSGSASSNGLTTSALQAKLQTGFSSSTWGILPGVSYPYLKWRFPTGPSVISGTVTGVSGGNGDLGLSAAVNGSVVATTHTGANGYYNVMVDPQTAGGEALTWLDGTQFFGKTITERGSAVGAMPASASGFAQGQATGLDIHAGYVSYTGTETSLSALAPIFKTAKGSLSDSNILYSVSSGQITPATNAGLWLDMTGASFTLDQSLALTGTGAATIQNTGGLTLSAGTTLSSAASGDAVRLASGGAFTNSAGSGAITTANGRWLVYLGSPTGGHSYGGLDSGNTAIWNTAALGTVTVSGNRYVFASQPTLSFAALNRSKTYGNTLTFGTVVGTDYSVAGLAAGVTGAYLGDTLATAMSGAPVLSSAGAAATASVQTGGYPITISLSGVSGLDGYAINPTATGATLTVNPLALAGSLATGSSTYGAALVPGAATFTNLVSGDSVSATVSVSTAGNLSSSGHLKAGSYTGIESVSALTGTDAGNYTIGSFSGGNYDVAQLALAGSLATGSSTYGAALVPGTATFTNLVSGDSVSATVSVNTTGNLSSSGHLKAGSYAGIESVSALTGTDAGNYTIGSFAGGNYNVGQRTLSAAITGNPTKLYDQTTRATLTPANFTLTGLASGDGFTVTQTVGSYASFLPGTGIAVTATLAPSDFQGVSGSDTANYVLPSSASGTGTIQSLGLNATAQATHKNATTWIPVLPSTGGLMGVGAPQSPHLSVEGGGVNHKGKGQGPQGQSPT